MEFKKNYETADEMLTAEGWLQLFATTKVISYRIIRRQVKNRGYYHFGSVLTLEKTNATKKISYLFIHLRDTGIEFWITVNPTSRDY